MLFICRVGNTLKQIEVQDNDYSQYENIIKTSEFWESMNESTTFDFGRALYMTDDLRRCYVNIWDSKNQKIIGECSCQLVDHVVHIYIPNNDGGSYHELFNLYESQTSAESTATFNMEDLI